MKKISLVIVPFMSIALLSSCGGAPTEYVVTFESNGGTHINTQKVKKGETAKEPKPAPTKTDYAFGGWFFSPDFIGGRYDFSTPITEDITLYADWNGGPTVQHTVTFVLNGATSSPIDPVKVDEGNPYPNDKIPANPTNPGHTFEGWSDKENTKSIVDLTKGPTINSDLILYAWWSDAQSIDITFNANGGYFDNDTSVTSKTVPTTYGQTPVAPTPTKVVAGQTSTFKGWDKTLTPAKPESEGGTTTYIAQWADVTNKCHVTFDGNGGTITANGDPRDVDYGGTIDTAPTVTRDGYGETTGWYDAATGGNLFTFGTSAVTSNMTLYAHWGDIKTYTVVFDANGGTYSETSTGTVTRNGITYNTMPTIPTAPTKIDSTGVKTYTFIGYDSNVVPVTGDNTNPITYTAQWKETTNTYMVTLDATDEGEFPDSTQVKTINVEAGSNLNDVVSTLVKPIYKDETIVKFFDKYIYEDGGEISSTDIVDKNTSIKATYKGKTLEECSWDEISTISSKGKEFAQAYFGAINPETPLTKTIMVNRQPHKVRIIGYGQDVDKNGNEIGITFEFANLISDSLGYSLASYWKNTDTTDDSNSDYTNSSIRKALTKEGEGDLNWFEKDSKLFSTPFVNKSVLDMLPSDLSSVLKTVKKTVNVKTDGTWSPTEFNDKLFLLNPKELGYSTTEAEDSTTYSFYEGHTRQTDAVRIKAQVKGAVAARTTALCGTDLAGEFISGWKYSYAGYHNGQSEYFWLRSPCTHYSGSAWHVRGEGYVDSFTVYNQAYGVAPAFCI